MITAGLMVAFWIGAGTQYIDGQASWRIPIGLQIAPGCILAIGATFLPFSPRWLISKGRNEEALKVLAKLHANGDKNAPIVVEVYNDIVHQIEVERAVSITSYAELVKGTVRRRLILGVFIQIFQQSTGINR